MTWADRAKELGGKPLIALEIDLDFCELEFGATNAAGTCPASGSRRGACFNTRATCPVIASYQPAPKTWRFFSHRHLPTNLAGFPNLRAASVAPPKLTPGGSPLGVGAEATITLQDSTDSDIQTDPYLADRQALDPDYSPENLGTLLGKFRARNKFYTGRPARLVEYWIDDDGEVNTADTRVRHYEIEEWKGPDAQGKVRIELRDPLVRAEPGRSLCPKKSDATLASDMTESQTTIPFASNTEAQAAVDTDKHVAIEDEIIELGTVDGSDVINCTRGAGGSEQSEHAAGDTIQSCFTVENQNVIDVKKTLYEDFAGIDSSLIDFTQWEDERDAHLAVYNLTTIIPEPTPVADLDEEIVESTGALNVWDEFDRKFRLKSDSPWQEDVGSLADDFELIRGETKARDKPKLQITDMIVWYAPKNYAEDMKPTNFRRARARTSGRSGPTQWDREEIKEVFSRWLVAGDGTTVDTLTQRQLARFQDPPVELEWALDAADVDGLHLSDVITVETDSIQDSFGNRKPTRMQITEIDTAETGHQYKFTGLAYSGEPTLELIIDTDSVDVNIASELSFPPDAVDVTVIVRDGAIVSGNPALSDDGLADGSIVRFIREEGHVAGNNGAGGNGGEANAFWEAEPPGTWFVGASDGDPGGDGRDGIEKFHDWTIDNSGPGFIAGGAGGGGGGAGFVEEDEVYGGGGGGGAQGPNTVSGGTGGTGEVTIDGTTTTEDTAEDGGTGDFSGLGTGGASNNPRSGQGDGGDGGAFGEDGQDGQGGQRISGGEVTQLDGGTGGTAGYAIRDRSGSLEWLEGFTADKVKGSVG